MKKVNISSLVIKGFLLIGVALLSGCAGSDGPPPIVATMDATQYALGVLPNGSTVWVSESNFAVSNSAPTSGSLMISGGTPGVSYTFS